MTPRRLVLLAALLVAALTLSALPAAALLAPASTDLVRWSRVTGGLSEPTQVLTAPGSPRIFVTQKEGMVRVVERGQLRRGPWLDLRSRIDGSGEGGLLSLAFHPDWRTTPRFWVAYTATNGDIVLARGRAATPDSARANERVRVLLRIPHESSNHFGGQLLFGRDRLLYLSTGDGGGAGDPFDNARDLTSLLGKVLRLDVLRSCGGKGYCVPGSNPLVGAPGRNELWLWGLRNPWRMSVDGRGALWVADVGQSAWEEVTRVPASPSARDLGWPCREGPDPYDAARCENRPRLGPTIAVRHDDAESLTGGYVYHGDRVPALRGAYVFGDFVTTTVWYRRPGEPPVRQRQQLGPSRFAGPTSFGLTRSGELLAVTYDGTLWRLRG